MRIRYHNAIAALALLAASAAPALATPNINGASIHPRVFNDCPGSIFNVNNGYPGFIRFSDEFNCTSFTNLHLWRLSSDGGASQAVFNNNDCFRFGATLILQGTKTAEAGLNVTVWWAQNDQGRLQVRIPDGEVAVFGGALPFYSFTANHGVVYQAGQPIGLEVIYIPHSNSVADPATIEYIVRYGGNTYSSGPLAFGNCNPAEEPIYGCYGILNNARVGGFLQATNGTGPGISDALWEGIFFEPLCPVGTEPSTFGRMKALYR